MTTKHISLCKSISLFAFAISLFLLSSCSSYDEDITEIEVTITDEAHVSFDKDGGAKSIEVKSNKNWSVVKGEGASWIEVSPTNGLEGATLLTVSVQNNEGSAREGFFTIIAAESEKTITVMQNGKDGSAFEYATILEIRKLFTNSGQKEMRITQSLKLKGVVISDVEGGNNLTQKEGFIQDEIGQGISFRITEKTHSFKLGDLLNINLEGATISNNSGGLMIAFSTEKTKVQSQGVIVKPNELTIEEIVQGDNEATLVKIKDVQFRTYKNLNYYEGKANTLNRVLENEYGAILILSTTKSAKFKDEPLPAGLGNIVGIVSKVNGVWQIVIRNLDDVSEMSTIVIDKENVIFENKGGNETIKITANVDWVANSDESWLTITPNRGSKDGAITVTVTENKGEERKAIITISDGEIVKTVHVTQRSSKENGNVATDLFFSEYVEGSSNNKYLEIFNGTGRAVDLSDYKVCIYVNGQNTAKYTEELTGILEDKEVVVLQHPKATIYSGVTIESTAINFNGNDAIALIKISTDAFVDIFGRIGEDPGKAWTTSIFGDYLTTLNSTLVRKSSVSTGVTVNPIKEFPSLKEEWIMYPVDTIDYLGKHTMN